MDSLDGCINTFNSRGMKTCFWAVWWNSATYGLIWNSHIQINITAWWHMVLRTSTAIWTHMVTLLEKTQQHNPILGSFFFLVCLFLEERQSLTLAHCHKPQPICDGCWQRRERISRLIKATEQWQGWVRTGSGAMQQEWLVCSGQKNYQKKKNKKLKCLSTHFA